MTKFTEAQQVTNIKLGLYDLPGEEEEGILLEVEVMDGKPVAYWFRSDGFVEFARVVRDMHMHIAGSAG